MLRRGLSVSLTVAVLLGFALAGNLAASSAIGLGTTGAFAVLGGSTVTNTGPSIINGDLGVSPGTAVTGFPPGIVNGTIHAADAVAAQAQSDLTAAYNNAAGQACDTNLTGQDLGGQTLTAGVYCFDSSAGLTGALTLNAQGVAGARFIFQVGSALTTASSSSVSLINGAQLCNVFWQIGSSATLGTATSFVGNIMALTSITMTTRATLQGRALARNGAVTLDTNVITKATCDTAPTPTATPTLAPTPTVAPTATPTLAPTPTAAPTATPTATATSHPELVPTASPGLPDTSTARQPAPPQGGTEFPLLMIAVFLLSLPLWKIYTGRGAKVR